MSWKTSIYCTNEIHVYTEPNFERCEEETADICIGDREDLVVFPLESAHGQAIYNAFCGLQEGEAHKDLGPTVITVGAGISGEDFASTIRSAIKRVDK